jgi:hypothetical protein
VCLALVAVAWVQATVVLRRRYLERFQRELGEGRVTAASIGGLDLASAEVLVAGLGSSSVREVLAALDVLAGSGRLGLVPALILYHPDPLVVRSALRLLSRSQRPDVDALLPSCSVTRTIRSAQRPPSAGPAGGIVRTPCASCSTIRARRSGPPR